MGPNIFARDFTAEAPDKAWAADTTYLPVLVEVGDVDLGGLA